MAFFETNAGSENPQAHDNPTPEEVQSLDSLADKIAKIPPGRQEACRDSLSKGPKPPRKSRARHNVRSTSIDAKRKADRNAPSNRQKLQALFAEAGECGLIDSDICELTDWPLQSVTPLRGSLVRSGKVFRTDRVRNTPRGNASFVWVAREFVPDEIVEHRCDWVPTGNSLRVLTALQAIGDPGLSDHDGARRLKMLSSAYTSARYELKQAGLVKESGRYEVGDRGQKRIIWIACDPSKGGEA